MRGTSIFRHELGVLPNGLRLITIPRPGTPTVAVRAYVRAGSRYDAEQMLPTAATGTEAEAAPALGLAHLAEHLLFKGTRTRSQRLLFAAIETLGGTLEAETGKEYASYSVVVPPQELDTALEILAELLSQPSLDEGSFWGEKLVVVQEVRRAQDQVGILMDLFAETLWQAHPLRYPVLGTLEGLRDVEHGDMLAFHRQRYVSGNMLLVVCGDLDAGQVTQAVTGRFAGLPTGSEQRPAPVAEPPLDGRRTAHLSRELGQTQLLIGVPTVSMAHDDRSPLKVVERVLGMGGSARLYQRLREEKRLVYSVQTVTAPYEDVGYFAVRTACDPHRVDEVQQAILDEWARLCDEGVTGAELHAAQGNYAGTLARRFETNLAVAGIHGVEGLLHRVEPFEEAIGRINAVQAEDVRRVARQYLDPECYVAVTVGRRGDDSTPEGPES